MEKYRKYIIIGLVSIILIVGAIFGIYNVFKDENSLSIKEKTWINNNLNSVYSINVPNDVNIFGKNGSGVFFDFINDLEEDLELKLNTIVYSSNNNTDSFGFEVSNSYNNRDLLIYTDYYVLVSKDSNSINDINDIKSSIIGIINSDLNYISSYYTISGSIKSYDNNELLFDGLNNGEVNYIIVPLNKCKDMIINKGLNVSYFFNDAKVYYYLQLGLDSTLDSILTKYYNIWMKDSFSDSYNSNNYNLFLSELGISDLDEDLLTDKAYKFEYLVNQPYQLLSNSKFTGIVSGYLNSFQEFSDIEIEYNKVRNFKDFKYDLGKNKFDLYFDMYNIDTKYNKININYTIDYYLISNREIAINVDSLKAYNGTIYVLENSYFYKYLSNYSNINIKTYDKNSDVKGLLKKGNVVIIDRQVYDNYLRDSIGNNHILLEGSVDNYTYTFNYINNSDVFYKLFKSYVNTLNPKEIVDDSLHNYFDNYKVTSTNVTIAKYVIISVLVIGAVVYLYVKSKKKIVLNTKVKNNEKIRYVDMLTSLKNRNYLNERIEIWNQNTVYPQCVIVLDLNNIKYLNDTFGHEEGDKQIKAVANILFKTQLENTELLRTDGNEFMIYLVGYSEKKVVSYIKKLVKEFKKLPYEYGVAIGFSMIEDDLKLVEDAFNEATLLMRKNKDTFGEYDEN